MLYIVVECDKESLNFDLVSRRYKSLRSPIVKLPGRTYLACQHAQYDDHPKKPQGLRDDRSTSMDGDSMYYQI
jgi:hypothetical protein